MNIFTIVAAGAAVAGFVQGLSGFAFGLVAMSLWAWTLEPRVAVGVTILCALTGQLVSAATVRRGFNPRLLLPFVTGALAGIPLGMAILPHVDARWFKGGLGVLLVVWCPAMLVAHRLPRLALGRGAPLFDGLAGAVGGVMGGIGGFTGPVPTLWITLRGFEKQVQRSIIQNFNLAALGATAAMYAWAGHVTRDMLPLLAVAIPAMLVPNWLGSRVYIGLSEEMFRKIVLGLLTLSGAALLLSALP